MESPQLILTACGLIATAGAIIKAGSRLQDLSLDYRYARLIFEPDRDERLEILMTKNLYRAQLVRFFAYLGILILFIIPLLLPPLFTFDVINPQWRDQIIFVRSGVALLTLGLFAAEEFYLDRARDRWLSDIRKARNGTS